MAEQTSLKRLAEKVLCRDSAWDSHWDRVSQAINSANGQSDEVAALSATEERAAIIEYEGGIPRDWAEGCASLDEACPPADIHPARWAQILDDGGMFIDQWAAKAASLSWTAVDVFGISPVKPETRFDRMGLVALLKGRPVVAITEDSARIKTESGHQTYQRTKMQGAQTVWEVT